MKTLKFFSFVLLTTLFVVSCSKRGAQGPPGINGQDGYVNVVSGTITTADWVYYQPSWRLTINYNMITRDVIEYGAVLIYMQDGNAYRQLPLTLLNNVTGTSYYYSTIIDADTYVGGVDVYWTDSDFEKPENPGLRTFKIVVIAASDYYKNTEIDHSDYNQVKEAYNLAD